LRNLLNIRLSFYLSLKQVLKKHVQPAKDRKAQNFDPVVLKKRVHALLYFSQCQTHPRF